MSRGMVLGLSREQVAMRAKYLAGLVTSDKLDSFVRSPTPRCTDGYYLLKDHNGGRDPTASDPFDRWPFQDKQGGWHTAITADCVGGAAWCGGWDRYQQNRFGHIYGGWINVDSICFDAFGPAKCFVPIDRPEPGCFLTGMTGSKYFEGCGHITTVHEVPAEWDYNERSCWDLVGTVDVAMRTPAPANHTRSAALWFEARRRPGNTEKFSAFVRCIMVP